MPDSHSQTGTKSDKPAEPSITSEFNLGPIRASLYRNVTYKIETDGGFSFRAADPVDKTEALYVEHTGQVEGYFSVDGRPPTSTRDLPGMKRFTAFDPQNRSKALLFLGVDEQETSQVVDNASVLTRKKTDVCSVGTHTAQFAIISDAYQEGTHFKELALAYGAGHTPSELPSIYPSVTSEVPLPTVPDRPPSSAASTVYPGPQWSSSV